MLIIHLNDNLIRVYLYVLNGGVVLNLVMLVCKISRNFIHRQMYMLQVAVGVVRTFATISHSLLQVWSRNASFWSEITFVVTTCRPCLRCKSKCTKFSFFNVFLFR